MGPVEPRLIQIDETTFAVALLDGHREPRVYKLEVHARNRSMRLRKAPEELRKRTLRQLRATKD